MNCYITYNQKYRAKKYGVKISANVSTKWLRNLFESTKICRYCHRELVDYDRESLGREKTIDHIKPLSLGGNHTRRNIQILCATCNNKKRNFTEKEFYKRMFPEMPEATSLVGKFFVITL